jgi:hypothetical protein
MREGRFRGWKRKKEGRSEKKKEGWSEREFCAGSAMIK